MDKTKKQAKKTAQIELVYQVAEADAAEAEHQVNHAFDILFELAWADYQPKKQTV